VNPSTDSPAASATVLQREPYRPFFALGLALAWAGVLPWLLFGLGVPIGYPSALHATSQIQGFLLCFASGFLLTMIPRRTGTSPPAVWQIAVLLLAPVIASACAWAGALRVAQVPWLVALVALFGFVATRFATASAGRRPPHSFAWVPVALLFGAVGGVVLAVAPLDQPEVYAIGWRLVLQGTFAALILGVGGMVFPLVTQGEAVADIGRSAADRAWLAGHLVAALLLFGSFVVEVLWSASAGYALRAAVILATLLASARIYRRPGVPGWQRWWVWVSAWCVPLGYGIAALYPQYYQAGLHVTFIGGFALMTFSVALHVTLAHGGEPKLTRARLPSVALFGTLLLTAAMLRVLVLYDPARLQLWLTASSAVFLAATAVWGALAVPRLVGWRLGADQR